MRITRLAVVALGLGVALTGCTSTGTPGATGTGTPTGPLPTASGASPAASGITGPASACVVGRWRADGVNATVEAGGARGTATGGGGAKLTVAPDGKAVVDFAGMQPVTFTTQVSGTEIKGKFVYGGEAKGAVNVTSGGTTSANSGVWKPVGPADFTAVNVTVDLLTPVEVRVFDKARMADFAGAGAGQTGGTVDSEPLLREATYECSGNTLTLGPPRGSTGFTWTLKRV